MATTTKTRKTTTTTKARKTKAEDKPETKTETEATKAEAEDLAEGETETKDEGEGKTEAKAEDKPESFVLRLGRLVREDKLTLAGKAEDVSTLVDEAIPLAKFAAGVADQLTAAMGPVAILVLRITESFILPNGTPDWARRKAATKAAVSPIIEALQAEDEDYLTASNRLGKAVQRARDTFIALSVAKTEGIDIGEDDVRAIVTRGPAAAKAKDKPTKALVAAVNAAYDAQFEGDTKPANAPSSPFRDKPKGKGKTTPTTDEAKGLELIRSRKGLETVTRAKRVTGYLAACDVLAVAQAFAVRFDPNGSKPHYGTEGRERTAEVLALAVTLFDGVAKGMAEVPLTVDERAEFNSALSYSPEGEDQAEAEARKTEAAEAKAEAEARNPEDEPNAFEDEDQDEDES